MAIINVTPNSGSITEVTAKLKDVIIFDGSGEVKLNGYTIITAFNENKTSFYVDKSGRYDTNLGSIYINVNGFSTDGDDIRKAIGANYNHPDNYVTFKDNKGGGNPEQIKQLTDKVSTWKTPEEFNAIGDGIKDDTTSLTNMINSGVNKLKLGYGKTYKVTKQLPLKNSFMELDLNGSTILFDSSSMSTTNNNLFYVNNDKTDTNSKRANVTNVGVYYKIGNTPEHIMGKFTVDDVTKFKVGDTVVIEYQTALVNTHNLNDFKPCVGTHAKILEIDATNKLIFTDYYTELDFRNLPPVAGSGFMYVTTPIKNVTIKNGVIKSITKNSAGKKDCAIRVEYADGITLEDITVIDFNHMAIQQRWVRNSTARNIHSDVQQGDTYLSYVMQNLNLYKGIFENISGTSNDAILDFSFGSSYIYARNVHSSNPKGAWGAIQLHGECEHDIMFENCSGYFSFANNVGEFPGVSYNITLDNCKGASYLNGCDNLRIVNSNLIVRTTDTSNLRVYGVNIYDSKIKLVRSVLYKGSTRGGNISPRIRFSNCEVSPYLEAPSGLYKFPFIQFDEISFTNNCRVVNTFKDIGAYFMLDSIKDIDISNSTLDGVLFSIRTNDGGTASPFDFNKISLQSNNITLTDDNNGAKTFTTSLDAFIGFSNVADLKGKVSVKGNDIYFKKTHARPWKLIDIESITATSSVAFSIDNNKISTDTSGEASIYLPHVAGVSLSYSGNIVNPDIISEIGVYRLSNFYTAIPTSGTWEARKIILSKTPVAGGKLGWVCITGGSPGTWKAYGSIDA
jgi:hypothetical protein